MFCSKSDTYKSANKFLKFSLVPVPCQESQLNADGSTRAESIEWLSDLHNNIPMWSRLLDINTSGFMRKLPLSMTKNYDVEVEGRLWSLWGSERKQSQQGHSKSYMALTVMALCAARVLNVNNWNTSLMDVIKKSGRCYYKESFKQAKCGHKDFQMQNLLTKCNLQGIRFAVQINPVQSGFLFSTPLECQMNLAFGLINFFDCYQFGILECCHRFLGFGLINGSQDSYFMYDAQSCGGPVFPRNISAPYFLRTNHLQILLYCLVVALNISYMPACFCLHQVQIVIENPYKSKTSINSKAENARTRIIPSEDLSLNTASFTNVLNEKELFTDQNTNHEKATQQESPSQTKYRRKIHNIKEEEVQESLIKPLVDPDPKSDEDFQLKKDFVRMVCSDTVLPATAADLPKKSTKEFSCNLLDALFMGPEICLMFKEL